jgi:hypothetical protein
MRVQAFTQQWSHNGSFCQKLFEYILFQNKFLFFQIKFYKLSFSSILKYLLIKRNLTTKISSKKKALVIC